MTDTTTTAPAVSKDLALRVMTELGQMRASYVETRVSRINDRHEGRLTSDRIDELEAEFYQRWNELHPGLHELWFGVLGARA